MPRLPEELILDILHRLPVESLLQFRRVCKTWNILFKNPNFVHSSSFSILVKHRRKLYSLDHDIDDGDAPLKRICYPLKRSMEDVKITGSCNGLVCLSHGVVWNPTTSEYKVIPRSTTLPTQPDESIWGTYGFGYDASSQDYKFVRIVGSSTGKKSEVDVYSLGSNSWKRFQWIPYLISRGSGVFCNGALHWIAFSYSGNNGRYTGQVLIALDVGNESVQEIPQPENLDAGKFGAYRYASVLDRCLCMLCSSLMDGYEVWMMKDYGMRESWTKLYRIRALINTSASSGIEYLKKVVYLKNCEILLQIKQILMVMRL